VSTGRRHGVDAVSTQAGVSGGTLTRLRFVHTKGVSCNRFFNLLFNVDMVSTRRMKYEEDSWMKEKKLLKKSFRFSEREIALLERRAREAQMTQSDYIRVLVANRPRDNIEFTEAIKELALQVKHIGININQITIHNNIGALSEEEINRLQKYMAQIRKEFMEVVAIGDMPHV
jgi:hypothetical protein